MIERDAYEILQVHPAAHPLVIQAAYRTLAAIYHPDGDDSLASTRKMAELNLAYAKVRTADRRQLYDRERSRLATVAAPLVTPYRAPGTGERPVDPASAVLDFGRYNGLSIAQIAREDPDYLRWLARHSSGIRFRSQIQAVLNEPPGSYESDRFRGRGKR
jgi:curved DNA-binding protein CbpA